MGEANDDLRVRRTRKMVEEALLALTVEKGFAAVSVQDIAERAMINRATFYRHYLDKYDLLDRYMDRMYQVTASQEAARVLPLGGRMEAPPEGLVNLLIGVQQEADFYRVMLGKHGDTRFVQRMREYIEQRFRTVLADDARFTSVWVMPMDLVLSYLSHASVGAIVWWLNQEPARSPVEVAGWLRDLSQTTLALGQGR